MAPLIVPPPVYLSLRASENAAGKDVVGTVSTKRPETEDNQDIMYRKQYEEYQFTLRSKSE